MCVVRKKERTSSRGVLEVAMVAAVAAVAAEEGETRMVCHCYWAQGERRNTGAMSRDRVELGQLVCLHLNVC